MINEKQKAFQNTKGKKKKKAGVVVSRLGAMENFGDGKLFCSQKMHMMNLTISCESLRCVLFSNLINARRHTSDAIQSSIEQENKESLFYEPQPFTVQYHDFVARSARNQGVDNFAQNGQGKAIRFLAFK